MTNPCVELDLELDTISRRVNEILRGFQGTKEELRAAQNRLWRKLYFRKLCRNNKAERYRLSNPNSERFDKPYFNPNTRNDW